MNLLDTTPATGNTGTHAQATVLVLLAGGAAPSPITRVLGHSLLDLQILPDLSLLQWWINRDWAGQNGPRIVRTVRGQGSFAPAEPTPGTRSPGLATAPQTHITHLVDLSGPRGSAGALRDACEHDAPDTTIIAAESSTVLLVALEPFIAEHIRSRADVTLLATESGRPAGLVLLQRHALDAIKPRGYADLKEQLLPALAKAGRPIRVVRVPDTASLPLHDRRGILDLVARVQSTHDQTQTTSPPDILDPEWGPAVISPHARVDPTATVTASLVLEDATIAPRGVVARSIVARGAIVRPGAVVLDRIVTSDRIYRDEQLPLEHRRDWR